MEEEPRDKSEDFKRKIKAMMDNEMQKLKAKYESLLKTSLRASRRAYIKGKLETFQKFANQL